MNTEITFIGIAIFSVISLLSVLLHDFKYLFFLNGNNKLKAVIICGIFTLFNTIVTKRIAEVDLIVSCTVVTITNMISIYVAMLYSEKQLKEYIYTFEITTKYVDKRFELKDKFKELNIPYEYQYYYFENDKDKNEELSKGIELNEFGEALYHKYTVFAFTKKHSRQLENILNQYNYSEVKYIKTNTSNYKEN